MKDLESLESRILWHTGASTRKTRCNTLRYDACWHLGRFLILLSLPDKNVSCFHCLKVSFCLWDSTTKKQMVLEEIRFILIQAKAFFFFNNYRWSRSSFRKWHVESEWKLATFIQISANPMQDWTTDDLLASNTGKVYQGKAPKKEKLH